MKLLEILSKINTFHLMPICCFFVTTHTLPTSRGFSAGSSDANRMMDLADKPRDVENTGWGEQLRFFNATIQMLRFSPLIFASLMLSLPSYAVKSHVSNIPTVSPLIPISTSSPLAHDLFEVAQADWVFSGVVTNEDGEDFYYFFQMLRNKDQFNGLALLINASTNNMIFYETSEASIAKPDGMQWQVGHLFLRFNTINNSWVFGVKAHDKKGFNFKIDMIGQDDGNIAKQQDLRTGLELLIGQTGGLNGHLQTGEREQFVTAKKSWFRQMWVSKPQESSHPFTAILCDFDDGAGFYSVNLQENDALRGAMAGWRSESGEAMPMSQFVSATKAGDGLWHVQVPFPKLVFALKDAVQQSETKSKLAAGAIDGRLPGYCVITQYELG